MLHVETNQFNAHHYAAPTLVTAATSNESVPSIELRPRLCILHKWPHYDGYGVHLARNEKWSGLRVGDIEPNSPAESAGLLCDDVILSINGNPVDHLEFFHVLSLVQHELQQNEMRLLVIDPQSANLVRRHQIQIDENHPNCIRMETPILTEDPEKVLYEQWRQNQRTNPSIAPMTSDSNLVDETISVPNSRLCTVILPTDADSIGISLQSDHDFGHKIKQVEPNSAAERAGIQANDCILSLNHQPILHLPYEDVLNCLRQSREAKKMDLVVIQKSFLFKSKTYDDSLPQAVHGQIQQGIGPATTHQDQTVNGSTNENTGPMESAAQSETEKKPSSILHNILHATPVLPTPTTSDLNHSSENPLTNVSVADLEQHGYELHRLRILQPNNTTPVGLKLSRLNDPLQYIFTIVVEQSRADLAGLKVNDWLIEIENNDIRQIDFSQVSRDIQHLLINKGELNILVARKISPEARTTEEKPTVVPEITLDPSKINEKQVEGIRRIALNEALGLDFNSYLPDDENQKQVHFISNVQQESIAQKAGLKNGDRILSINGVETTDFAHDDVRRMLMSRKPIELTVINEPKYLELVETVKKQQQPIPLASNENFQDWPTDLHKYLQKVFQDDQGALYCKKCTLKKEPSYDSFGFLLRYADDLHVIDAVEPEFPAFNAGLRENDVVLCVNKENVEEKSHEDVKKLIRTLANANMPIDLILIQRKDIERFKEYQQKNTIDWKPILSSDNETFPKRSTDETQSTNNNAIIDGSRVCIVETIPNRTAGFAISGIDPPPFKICRIEKNSPAEKAGLRMNDGLLSINGRPLTSMSYEEAISIVKEELLQKRVQVVVKPQPLTKAADNRSSVSGTSSLSNAGGSEIDDKSHRGANAVQQYQNQRNKEASYTLRLCHLNALNSDGAPAPNFGFEISENSTFEYPIISRIEPKSPGDRAGLQVNDILLKINDRKTKGLEFDKVKKAIEKAKRDGRLEMLVVDVATYDYCQRTKKPLKEPDLKLKHIFPKSRSSTNNLIIPVLHSTSNQKSPNHLEELNETKPSSSGRHHFSLENDDDEDDLGKTDDESQPSSHADSDGTSDLSAPARSSKPITASASAASFSHSTSSKKHAHAPLKASASNDSKSKEESKKKAVTHVIANFLQKVGSNKSKKR